MLKLTVVIPLYNKEDYVRGTIVSLAQQYQKPHEIIVVDDASTDMSLAIVKSTFAEFEQEFGSTSISIIELKENAGPGNARNIGLQSATGDLISFLDADDSYHRNFTKTVTDYMYTQQIDFLVIGFELQPSNILCPDICKLRKYLTPLNRELNLLSQPLLAVSSPHFFMGRGSNVVVFREFIGEHRYESGAVLNEGVDFWYRVLKDVTSREQAKVALLYGDYIRVTEVQGSLSRRKYVDWKELQIPPSVRRYKESKNVFDRQLSGMLTLRWCRHAMKSMNSFRQKMRFVFHYKRLLLAAVGLKIRRGFLKK